jgi:hypothetical protein
MYIHGQFYNELNDRIEVLILTHGDRGEELEIGDGKSGLYFSDDPVETMSEVNDTFDHLLRQQATVRLLTRNFVQDFFCSSCKDAVVNIYREGVCLFAGYVEPQTYSQDYNEELDEIELSCIDALTALQYAKYRDVGSLGVLYSVVKGQASQRTFLNVMKEMLGGVAAGLDIKGGSKVHYWYDGSKAVDSQAANRHAIFGQLSINELLFLGDGEDDVWQQDTVLEEMLRYLNLHIMQDGMDFYIFSWETLKGDKDIYWRDLLTGERLTTARITRDITTQNVVGTDTSISVGEVYSQLLLTCDVKSVESVIKSPLDNDLVRSPFSNKQKYLTEYSSDGEGEKAIDAFDAMTHGRETDFEDGRITDWYMQVMDNPEWTFTDKGTGSLIEQYAQGNKNQERLPGVLAQQPGAAIIAFGKVERKTDGKDNAPVSRVEMTNCLFLSVNGNGEDKDESKAYPNETSIKASAPYAVYNGNTTGGVFSPSDDDTTNYIVLSGSIALNPVMKMTDTYKAIYDYTPSPGVNANPLYGKTIRQWWQHTVPSRDNGDGRYYTQKWWKAATPGTEPEWDQDRDNGLVPFTEKGPQEYEFQYSAIGDSSDQISKVGMVACMLIIGDQCVVETGSTGKTSDYEWHKYKERSQCDSDDEYYQQSFTIGFDPKIGDKLIGTKFNLQNNIDYKMGIDAEGIAIPIRKKDKVSGAVKFVILGPVNVTWDVITRRHPTFFRHTKWSSSTVALLPHVSSIVIESFEMKVYSDNGLVNNTGDNDIVYLSDTKETFVNRKDDISFKISSALTSAECHDLGVTDSVKMSTPVNTQSGESVLSVYDYARELSAKPEQLYVDSYYQEYHAPRIMMTQKLRDKANESLVNPLLHYRHPAMDRTFFVQGISRNINEGSAEMNLKEIDQ